MYETWNNVFFSCKWSLFQLTIMCIVFIFPETTDALIVSFGYATTHILPILGGKLQATKSRRIGVGGANLEQFLQRILQLKHPGHYAHATLPRAQVGGARLMTQITMFTINSETCLDRPRHERPPLLKEPIFLAEGHIFQCNWTCRQRPPVFRDQICMAHGVVFQERFHCIGLNLLLRPGHSLITVHYKTIAKGLLSHASITYAH